MKRDIFIIKLIVIAAILFLLMTLVWIFSFNNSRPSQPRSVTISSTLPQVQPSLTVMTHKVIHVAGQNITVSIADTPTTQQRGLGGRVSLNTDEGMLFVFPKDAPYAFWMKDMHFSIDIIWLSADGTVITIAHNVSPDTYPHSFVPRSPARYVVELPAGFAQTHNLKVGDRVQF